MSHSQQYKAVLHNMETLRMTLGAEDLLLKFQEKEWLSIASQAKADELIRLALDRIKNDIKDYEVFISMLQAITGLSTVTSKITDICPVTTASIPMHSATSSAPDTDHATNTHQYQRQTITDLQPSSDELPNTWDVYSSIIGQPPITTAVSQALDSQYTQSKGVPCIPMPVSETSLPMRLPQSMPYASVSHSVPFFSMSDVAATPSYAAVPSPMTRAPPQIAPSYMFPPVWFPQTVPVSQSPATTTVPRVIPSLNPVRNVEQEITHLEQRFDELKERAISLLEKNNIPVTQVVYKLTTLPADEKEEHRVFLESKKKELQAENDHYGLFGSLKFYWNYLAYHLLDHLINKISCLEIIKNDMNAYKEAVHQFRVQTPLKWFCKANKTPVPPKEGFKKVVAEFKQLEAENMTLEELESLRKKYSAHYNLHDCAMMLCDVQPGCFIVSFLIPDCITAMLKQNIPENVLKKYYVTKLVIAGEYVYTSKTIASTVSSLHHFPKQVHSEHPERRRHIRPVPPIPVSHFRLCPFRPPQVCKWGDNCTFAHNMEEKEAWNNEKRTVLLGAKRQLHELHSLSHLKPNHPQTSGDAMPVQSSYRPKNSTFLDRRKEELHIDDIRPGLTAANYKEKFQKLLCWEKMEHITLLHDRCDGYYQLTITGSLPPEISKSHSRSTSEPRIYGYLHVPDSDKIAYATQASEAVYLIFRASGRKETEEIKVNILRDNFSHVGKRMYISMDPNDQLPHSGEDIDSEAQFEVKHFFFDNLHNALKYLPDEIVKRLLPQNEDFDGVVQAERIAALDSMPNEYRDIFHLKKIDPERMWAYQVALTCKSGAPPVLISGAFGTGKTCFLSSLAYFFIAETDTTHVPSRVLICSHHQATADTILYTYLGPLLENRGRPLQGIVKVVRITSNNYRVSQNNQLFIPMYQFKKESHKYDKAEKLVIITTFLTSFQLKDLYPPGFFTHILIDEGAQAREPEAVAPLCMADQDTKIIIAGDPQQVGPALLVLGKETRKHGLSISLLERLISHYKNIGEKTNYLQANLKENYRCHPLIMKFASDMFYESTVRKPTNEIFTVSEPQFPLVFVCTGTEHIKNYKQTVNATEAFILMNMLQKQNKNTDKTVCVMSSSRGQVTVLRNERYRRNMPQSVRVLPTFDIQSQEYDSLYISTYEPTCSSGETRNPTKSICDPFVFNTAITRARSLVVSFGNPYLLLSIEDHMYKKYSERGRCWSQYIMMCLDNESLIIPTDVIRTPQQQMKFKQELRIRLNTLLTQKMVSTSDFQSCELPGLTMTHLQEITQEAKDRLFPTKGSELEKISKSGYIQAPEIYGRLLNTCIDGTDISDKTHMSEDVTSNPRMFAEMEMEEKVERAHSQKDTHDPTPTIMGGGTLVSAERLSIECPGNVAGLIIGKTLRDIESKTGTKLYIKDKTNVVICGDRESCERALVLIVRIIRRNSGLFAVSTKTVTIPNKHRGRVIGREGVNIHAIENLTGTSINVLPPRFDSHTKCEITGSFDRIERAKEMIRETLERDNKAQAVFNAAFMEMFLKELMAEGYTFAES